MDTKLKLQEQYPKKAREVILTTVLYSKALVKINKLDMLEFKLSKMTIKVLNQCIAHGKDAILCAGHRLI